MTNQTQDYITLKPIAERFKQVAMSISDEEIKQIIISELQHQVHEQVNFGMTIAGWVDDILNENEQCWIELIMKNLKESIERKFK